MSTLLVVSFFILVSLSPVRTDKERWQGAEPLEACKRTTIKSQEDKIELDYLKLIPECTKDYCRVVPGSRALFWAHFTLKKSVKDLRAQVHMIPSSPTQNPSPMVGGLGGGFGGLTNTLAVVKPSSMLYETSMCDQNKYNVTCPIKANVPIYAFFNGTYPDINFPSPTLNIKMVLMDDSQRELICYAFKIKVEGDTRGRKG